MGSAEIHAYAQAAESGRYDRVTGLQGKYDHVRLHWEDQSVRIRVRPHLQPLVDRRLAAGRGLRLLDLGCGSGDGFDTLLSMRRGDVPWAASEVALLPPQHVDCYTGIEMNPALLEQAGRRHGRAEMARFVQADLRGGLPPEAGEEPYDLYFASFGTLSHLGEDDTVRLLADLARHAADGSLIVIDWLGRFAYEWTDLWNANTSREQWMDYRISYIYSAAERQSREIDSFPLRLLDAEEARRVFTRAEQESRSALVEKDLFDRSLFVGRHMETAEYNPHARPLRSAVNRLHEPLCRTDLNTLRFELHLPEGFPGPAEALREAHAAWNALVDYTAEALARADAGASLPEVSSAAPPSARRAMGRLRAAIGVMDAVEADDPRAEWIEPQLGVALRNIELAAQHGCGCGHGLVAIYEVRRR
jgi:SAM-dependent methyltransferase